MGNVFGGGGDVQAPDYTKQIEEIKAAAERSAAMGKFRPVTVTTSFGTPQYTYDDQGRLVEAQYTPSSWLQNLMEGGRGMTGAYQQAATGALADTRALQAAGLGYGAGQTLYERAAQALPESYDTAQATQDYYNRMQQLVAPQREQQLAQTRQSLFNKGRTGLATGATQAGGMLATNPEMAAYYNAIAQQDLNLANQAEQQALANLTQRQQMATGLFGTGASQLGTGADISNAYYRNITAAQVPIATGLANLGTMETMAQQPLALGLQFGQPTTQGMQFAANTLYGGAESAANLGAAQERARVEAANANQGGDFWDALGGMALTAGIGALTGGLGSAATGALGLGGMGGGGLFSSLGSGLGGAIGSGFSSSSMNPLSSAGSAMRSSGFGWTPSGYTIPQGWL